MSKSPSKPSKSALDNRANQLNPSHPAYHLACGAGPAEAHEKADSGQPSSTSSPTKRG